MNPNNSNLAGVGARKSSVIKSALMAAAKASSRSKPVETSTVSGSSDSPIISRKRSNAGGGSGSAGGGKGLLDKLRRKVKSGMLAVELSDEMTAVSPELTAKV